MSLLFGSMLVACSPKTVKPALLVFRMLLTNAFMTAFKSI